MPKMLHCLGISAKKEILIYFADKDIDIIIFVYAWGCYL
jgi:hypothetical protein